MSFDDIKGHDRQIEILKKYIQQERFCGTYLFSGPPGVGKKLIAKAFAKAVNYEQDLSFQHPDMHIIDGDESEIKIETIRQLQKDISLRPYEAKVKVFIIDNAHKISPEAQSAFLKVLEEPPVFSVIILITDKPALLLKTIISRCKVLKFSSSRRAEPEADGDVYSLAMDDREGAKISLNKLVVWLRDVYLVKAGIREEKIINLSRREKILEEAAKVSFVELERAFDFISAALLYLEQNVNTKLLQANLKVNLWKV